MRLKAILMSEETDDQYEWFLSQQCDGPIIDAEPRSKKLSEWTFKETVQVLFAIFFLGFVACPFFLFAAFLILGIVARLNGH
jgi:hypothetical protein